MTTYFVSRHPGAIAWAEQHDLVVDQQISHLDITTIREGDIVIGNLPIHLAARVCQTGGRYFHLSLNLPMDKRGRELSVSDLQHFGTSLKEFHLQELQP